MANWSDLKSAVASIVKTNGNKEITGQLLQNVLNNIISNVGLNSTFAGIATPEINPGTPDGNVFYLATTAGIYSNFGGIEVKNGEAVILEWNGSWKKKDSGFSTHENVISVDASAGAYSGYHSIQKNKLYSFDGGKGSIANSETYDCAFVRILQGSSKIEVVGAVPKFFVFFNTPYVKKDDYMSYNKNGDIPNGAKFCVIDFLKEENTEGYDNMRIRQEGGGVDKVDFERAKLELSAENERLSFNQTFSINKLVNSLAVEEESITYEVMENKFFSEITNALKDNANYDCWKADVESLRGSFLHTNTTSKGDIKAVSFVDENETFISNHFDTEDINGANLSLYSIVPKTAKYVYVNYNKNTPTTNPGMWKVKRLVTSHKEIIPAMKGTIDALSIDGKMMVVPNACAIVDRGTARHGNIEWNATEWHMGIYKLRSNEPLQLVGAKSSIFMYYSSSEFNNKTLVGYNSSETQEIPEGAKYCCIDFDDSIDIEQINSTIIKQTNTFPFHENALRKTKQVLIERDYTKDEELYYHGLKIDGTIEESEYIYGVSIFHVDNISDYIKIMLTGSLYGQSNYATYACYDENDTLLMSKKLHSSTRQFVNLLEIDVPINTKKIAVLYYNSSSLPTLYGALKEGYISSSIIKNDLNDLEGKSLKCIDTVVQPLTVGNAGLQYVGGYTNNSAFFYNEYLISDIGLIEGERLLFKAGVGKDSTITFIVFYDEEGNAIGGQHSYGTPIDVDYDIEIIIPEKTYKMVINSSILYGISLIKRKYESFTDSINEISEALEKLSEKINIQMTEKKEGYFISNGTDKANSAFHTDIYSIEGIEDSYFYASGGIGSGTSLSIVNYYDGNTYLGRELYYTQPIRVDSVKIVPPFGTNIIKLVSNNSNATKLEYAKKEGYYKSEELNNKIVAIEKGLGISNKLMKLVLYGTEISIEKRLFYIRSRYNSNKDIIVEYRVNGNTIISPTAAFVGDKSLSDADIMVVANRMSYHSDSTAPLFNSSVYWHLFAQHGYPVPRISNTIGMTSNDVGALWKDQLNREYTIGNVTETVVTLLPIIYKDENGNDTRGWKTPNDKAITTLTHVSGGVQTVEFTTENLSSVQLEPIMKHSNRVFIVDGKEVTEAGTFYCDEFKVSESQLGYDPASIQTWFPTPVLDNAKEMARFTWSYNFKGANCCVNTTIDIRTRVECQSYGATQQQTFFDNGNYKAMFMIPKAAARNGVELDKPFNSPSSSSPGYSLYRTSSYLKDINDPIDRLIAYLHNPSDNSYLFGMAAGLSLVSGDTVKEKRIASMPIGDKNSHYRVGSISPSNTNKFYIAAVNTAEFEDDNYHFPTTYFKEINYYLSFFDPSENEGQVYWYKDGNNYVIYMHCQTEQSKLAIKLPDFMEGLSVEIVEKTEGSKLLTDTIQNGKLYVNYSEDANYIVLKTV